MSNLGYSIREAFRHFRRNLSTSLGAVVTIFLSLFVIGTFLLGGFMLNSLVGDVEDRVTIQAFLSDDAVINRQSEVEAYQSTLQTWEHVTNVTYKSKEEALQEYRETMSNRNAEEAVAALDGENPVPASFVIELDDAQEVEAVAQQLVADPAFASICDDPDEVAASVLYGRETVERLLSVTTYIRYAMIALAALLVFVAFVFINNTIHLAISARRREIAIERLVGASNSFIRGPFVAEAVLQALFASVLAVVSLHFGVNALQEMLQHAMSFLNFTIPTNQRIIVYVALPLMGMLLGFLGSAIAMRRYLKV
jgi:cell division transport system permease protein